MMDTQPQEKNQEKGMVSEAFASVCAACRAAADSRPAAGFKAAVGLANAGIGAGIVLTGAYFALAAPATVPVALSLAAIWLGGVTLHAGAEVAYTGISKYKASGAQHAASAPAAPQV